MALPGYWKWLCLGLKFRDFLTRTLLFLGCFARIWWINIAQLPGQVFAKFEVYKALAMIENEKNYPGQLAGLPDPSLFAVRQQTSTGRIYGGTQSVNTAVFTTRSNILGSDTLLTDQQNMSFMVNVQKWLRDNFRQQTKEVLASYPPTGLHPSKKQKLTEPQ